MPTNSFNNIDGVNSNIIFCMWTGLNGMSAQRINALWSIFNNTHCPVVFINHISYKNWELKAYPFHEGFKYLSETHKSDYLRCYLMHHFGGGYTDLKLTQNSWIPFFENIRCSSKVALGYQEIPGGIPHVSGPLGDEIRANYKSVIGLCSFIFKRNTPLTRKWYDETHLVLDSKLEELRANSAKHPQDQFGAVFEDGVISKYPLRWAQILGEIFHPIIYENRSVIIQDNIAPIFHSYR